MKQKTKPLLPYLKSSFRSHAKNIALLKSSRSTEETIKKSKSTFSLIRSSRLSTNPDRKKILFKKDKKILSTLLKKFNSNTLQKKDIVSSLKKVSSIKEKMKILDIAVRHKEDETRKKKEMKHHFTFQKHIFLIVKFINSLKAAVRKKRKQRQMAFKEGILPILRTSEKQRKLTEILEDQSPTKKCKKSVFFQENTKRSEVKKSSFQTHKKLFNLNKNAYTLDLVPKSSIIEETEIPIAAKKRIDSPTLRKTRNHYQKVRYNNKKRNRIKRSIQAMDKMHLRSERLKKKMDMMIVKSRNRNKRFTIFRKKRKRKRRGNGEESYNSVDKLQLLSGLIDEDNDEEINKTVQRTFLSSLNKLKKLHDIADRRNQDFVFFYDFNPISL